MSRPYIPFDKELLLGFHFWLEHIIVRDFTKRQLKILGLIYLLSSKNQKLECYIPTLSSFELVGISRHKIKNEIKKLVDAKIINWEKESMTFIINTNSDEWKIKMSENYKRDRIDRLIALNDQISKKPAVN